MYQNQGKMLFKSTLWLEGFFLLLCLSRFSWANGADSLIFSVDDQSVDSVLLSTLQKNLNSHSIEVTSPYYAENKMTVKHYEGFRIQDILNWVYGQQWQNNSSNDISFIAADGYKTISSGDIFKQTGGYLVYKDLDVDQGWQTILSHGNKLDPGPFFLVWTGEKQTSELGFPWPWQVTGIEVIQFENQYPKVYPQGISLNSKVFKGFAIFKKECIQCHAMDQQGGMIGPDLNAPQNILDYRSRNMVKAYIRDPQTFRYSKMPSHLHLTEQELEQLIDYFTFMGRSK
ncbi:cytochrome c [uncultured Shewanella sp.]|uniref:c-type cytochrome n=1 Tax=uncultured Shewanella sp. TaxID=173975 RepID=UPI0026330868|nr:cytochrome c [uncultured Shewanella sp.]